MVVVAKSYAMAWRHLDAARQSRALDNHTGAGGDDHGQADRPAGAADCRRGSERLPIGPLDVDWPCSAYADPGVLDLQRSRLAPAAKTDAEGKLTIGGLPRDVRVSLIVTHPEQHRELIVVATTDKPQPEVEVPQLRGRGNGQTRPKEVFSASFSGGPGPGVAAACRADHGRRHAQAACRRPDLRRTAQGITTGEDGRFSLDEIRDARCRLLVMGPAGRRLPGPVDVVDVPRDKRETQIDIELPRGETLSGTVADEETGQGRGRRRRRDGLAIRILRATSVGGLLPSGDRTDGDGRFRLVVPPGKGKVRISGAVRGYDLPRPSGDRKDIEGFFREVEVVAGKPTGELKFTAPRMTPGEEKPVVRREVAGRSRSLRHAQATVHGPSRARSSIRTASPRPGAEVRSVRLVAQRRSRNERTQTGSFRSAWRRMAVWRQIVVVDKQRDSTATRRSR